MLNTKPGKEPTPDDGLGWPKMFLPDDQNPKSEGNRNSENLLWGVGDKPLEYLNFELGVGDAKINQLSKKYKLNTNEWYG
jgi:hypothetical protein